MTDRHDKDEAAESRRILKQISQETDGGRSRIDRARSHLAASDVDRGDWAEYWGTRIGRTIGAVFLVAMLAWLVFYLTQGA